MARSRRGKRYDNGEKLNVKKIIAVIALILVVVMFIVGINILLNSNSNSNSGMIENVCYYTIYDNGKWGVINSYGEVVIEATYDDMIVIPDSSKAIFVCMYDVNDSEGTYKSKVINEKGKEIISGYDKVEAIMNIDEDGNIWYESNVFKVEKDGLYGLVNNSGDELLSVEYNSIEPIQGIENSLIIEKDGIFGLCDDTGSIVIDLNYKDIQKIGDNYKNGYIVIDEEGNYGVIAFDKSVVLDTVYEEIKGIYSSNNLYAVKQNGYYVVIDKTGETVLENNFDDIIEINGENVVATRNGNYGVLNISGETVIAFEYQDISYMSSNYYIAEKNDKYGVISTDEEVALEFEYEDITYVTSGDFIVANYTENGEEISKIINSSFETKITGILYEIDETKGYIRMYVDDEYKYYNFKFEEKSASSILTTNTLFLSKQNGKYGFVDSDGNVVVDYIYDDATEQNSSGYAGVKKDGLWGAIDINGDIVIDPEYNLDNNEKIDFIGSWHLCEDTNANYYLDV